MQRRLDSDPGLAWNHRWCVARQVGISDCAGAADGKGRGRQVIAVARSCNLIFIVLDVLKPLADKAILESELYDCGIRLNVEPPQVQLKKKEKGA